MHVNLIDLLGKLRPYSFVVPEQVLAEIEDSVQSAAVTIALQNGFIGEVKLTDFPELGLYAELLRILGSGEAACLAVAEIRGCFIASDERKVFLREAVKLLGRGRILNTAGLLVRAIRLGVLTVREADDAKTTLEKHRFRMKFASFKDVV